MMGHSMIWRLLMSWRKDIPPGETGLLNIIEDTTSMLIAATKIVEKLSPSDENLDNFKAAIKLNLEGLDRERG